MGAKVNVNLSGVRKKLSSQNINRGRYAMSNQMVADMDQFVPARHYHLRQSGHTNSSGTELIWNTPYAKAQFYGTNGKAIFKNYTTAGTGSRWDLKAKSLFMRDWINAFNKGAEL